MASTSTLPVLLPPKYATPAALTSREWQPTRNLAQPVGPPPDDSRPVDHEMALARQQLDGKTVKKVRPRRTVDYGGGLGRWALLRKARPSSTYVPYLRPAIPYIVDLLPPKAYPDNAATSLCTKFVHTSTNKIRCPVNCVAWTPEGRRVLTGSTSGEFTLWNGLTFNFETILQAHDAAVRALQFTHSGAYLVSADGSGVIKYFQPNMNNLAAWQGHREAVRGLSFCPNDERFATASDDASIRIWSFAESRSEGVLTGHGWDVKCVEWHPTKGLLASGSKDNMIKFWDPRTGTVLSTLHYHKNTIQALAWSPNGHMLASASRDQTVRVFDIRVMKELRVLKGHKKEVCSVAWHPVHPLLVSGGSEGAVLHWDLSASAPTPAAPRATLSQAHDSNVWALAYHPLGHVLVSASNDHTTRFWCRERPGDAASVFSGGGEKPPDVGEADEEDGMGMGMGGMGGMGGGAMPGLSGAGWWREEEEVVQDDFLPGFGELPGMGSGGGGGNGGGPGGPGGGAPVGARQSGPLPSQEDMFGQGPPGEAGGEEWNRGGGGRGHRGGTRWGAARRGRH